MKYILLIIGAVLTLAALSRMSLYIFDYNQLSEYGRGYIWGNLLLLLIGLTMLYFGVKKRKVQND